jgi:hypothetical protein
LLADPNLLSRCSQSNRSIIHKDATRTFGSLTKSRDSLTLLQSKLEFLLGAYFSIHPEYDYFQGFNDIMAVLWLACQSEVETIYYTDKLVDKYLLNFLLPSKFSDELNKSLVFMRAFAATQKGLLDSHRELIHVLSCSRLRSEGVFLVSDLVLPRLDRLRPAARHLHGLELSDSTEGQ